MILSKINNILERAGTYLNPVGKIPGPSLATGPVQTGLGVSSVFFATVVKSVSSIQARYTRSEQNKQRYIERSKDAGKLRRIGAEHIMRGVGATIQGFGNTGLILWDHRYEKTQQAQVKHVQSKPNIKQQELSKKSATKENNTQIKPNSEENISQEKKSETQADASTTNAE